MIKHIIIMRGWQEALGGGWEVVGRVQGPWVLTGHALLMMSHVFDVPTRQRHVNGLLEGQRMCHSLIVCPGNVRRVISHLQKQFMSTCYR